MKRIRGVKPTLKQAKVMRQNNLNPDDWLVKSVYSDHLECIQRVTGDRKRAYFGVLRI